MEPSVNPIKIDIIGRGNVATHLHTALNGKASVNLVNPRSLQELNSLSDLIIIAVSDDAIPLVVSNLPETSAIIAHTSGSVPLSALGSKGSSQAVFYPLQTFTKDVSLKYDEIPVFLESSSKEADDLLLSVARLFTDKIYHADSAERRNLHLASVFACNFTNAMAAIAYNILSETNIDPGALHPLMKQTVNKLLIMDPGRAQTGPAARGDLRTIQKHLMMLNDKPLLKEIYSNISDFISSSKIDKPL